MVLNIKNLFKKVCMLSAAATMAVGLGASFAEAAGPEPNTPGDAMTGTINIYGTTFKINAIYKKGLKVAATPALQLVFESVVFKDTNDVEIKDSILTALQNNVYLRVKEAGATSYSGENDSGWVAVNDIANETSGAKVQKAGTYNVYYYVGDLSATDASGMNRSSTAEDHTVTESSS